MSFNKFFSFLEIILCEYFLFLAQSGSNTCETGAKKIECMQNKMKEVSAQRLTERYTSLVSIYLYIYLIHLFCGGQYCSIIISTSHFPWTGFKPAKSFQLSFILGWQVNYVNWVLRTHLWFYGRVIATKEKKNTRDQGNQ